MSRPFRRSELLPGYGLMLVSSALCLWYQAREQTKLPCLVVSKDQARQLPRTLYLIFDCLGMDVSVLPDN